MLTFDGTNINLLVAFLSGIITFFASCLLPLVPIYLAYLSGVTLSLPGKAKENRMVIFHTSLFFVLGFIIVFIVLGATLTTFARLIAPYRIWFERAGGLLFIFLGLYLSGVLKSAALSRDFHFSLNSWFKKNRFLHAFLTGVTFGFGWTPCIGPVLGVILFWSARQQTIQEGLLLLTVYGIGLGIPFIAVGLAFDRLAPLLKKSARFGHYLQIISGILIVFAGILLLLGRIQQFSLYLINFFNLQALSV